MKPGPEPTIYPIFGNPSSTLARTSSWTYWVIYEIAGRRRQLLDSGSGQVYFPYQ
jgi:hypothetical protein